MKRILLISPLPPLIGGVSVSTQRLYENLCRDGYQVNRYNLKFSNPQFNNAIGIVLRFFCIPFYILFHRKFDIIHCHVPGIFRKLYIALCKPLFKRSKLVFTIHGDITSLIPNKYLPFILRRADKVICVQPGDSLKLPTEYRIKSVDIPAFIMPTHISDEGIPTYILDFVKDKAAPTLIMNGSIILSTDYYDLYGFEEALNLFQKFKADKKTVKLLMIVNGNLNEEQSLFVKHLIDETKDSSNVLIVQNEHFELTPLFKYCDVCLRPTKTDGDSLTIREALAMHCRVVASDVSQRPPGTLIYHLGNMADFYEKTCQAIASPASKIHQPDYYQLIKQQYELLSD